MLELLLTVHEVQGWCWNMGVCLQSVKIKTNVGIWVSVYNPWRSRLILEHGCLFTVPESEGWCWNMSVCLQSLKVKDDVWTWVSVYSLWRSRLMLEQGCLFTVPEGQGWYWNMGVCLQSMKVKAVAGTHMTVPCFAWCLFSLLRSIFAANIYWLVSNENPRLNVR